MVATYKCPKCSGTGYLPRHAGIANGVCFSCEGNGFKVGDSTPALTTFSVVAPNRETGVVEVVYYQRAKTAAEAAKKAMKAYDRASVQWKNRYDMNQAVVESPAG